jgi:hypothetical protein
LSNYTGVKRFDTKTNVRLQDVGTNICGPEGPSIDKDGNVFFNTRRSPCNHSGIWKIAGGTSLTAQQVVPPFSDFGEGTAFLTSGPFAGHLVAAGSIIQGEFTVGAKIVRSVPPNFGNALLFIDLTEMPQQHVPVGIAVNSKGEVVVASEAAGALLQYDPSGVFKQVLALGLAGPLFLTFDALDNLYVAESDAGRVLKFTPDGTPSVLARDIPGVTGITIEKRPGTSPTVAQELSSLQ